ncbi:MAG: hypothetical protein OXT09_37495 [Myxococcales bacterium]|nr:hypothetical protein [Myxococcales bacterium]
MDEARRRRRGQWLRAAAIGLAGLALLSACIVPVPLGQHGTLLVIVIPGDGSTP